jgi:hypothetical protein
MAYLLPVAWDAIGDCPIGTSRISVVRKPDGVVRAVTSRGMIANGLGFTWEGGTPQGAPLLLYVCERWPIVDATLRLRVSAPGFRTRDVDVPLVAIGRQARWETLHVARERSGPVGTLRDRAMDADQKPIGPLVWRFVLSRAGSEDIEMECEVSETGVSPPFALAAGLYRVRPMSGGEPVLQASNDAVEVAAGSEATASVRLVGAAVSVDVRDEHDRPLDDVGVLLAYGAHGVRPVPSGYWQPNPGYGPPVRLLRLLPTRSPVLTVAAYRHGSEPSCVQVALEPGRLTKVSFVMRESHDSDTWLPR